MKWIKTKKCMPELGKDVLVFVNTKTHNQPYITVGYFCEQEKSWWSSAEGDLESHNFFVTHWMELPDMPKLEQCTISGVVGRSEQLFCSCGSIKVKTTGGSQCTNNRCSL